MPFGNILNKTILIAPLDWGIGHATRCVPVIEALMVHNKLIIGVTDKNRLFFQHLFPQLTCVELPAYEMTYHHSLPVWIWVLKQKRRLQSVIEQERACVSRLVKEQGINLIISDNRFGCYHPHVHSIYISHQLFIKSPFFKGIAQRINRQYILKFNEVWVPDFEEESKSLSGELSHATHYHSHVKYIGPLSRIKTPEILEHEFDYLLILSGPEPQQTIFKEAVIKRFVHTPRKKLAVVQTNVEDEIKGNIYFFNGIDPFLLSKYIAQSKHIICRSGYSTLMDLYNFMPKSLILVPTPGQPEQEYLAQYWQVRFNCKVVKQAEIAYREL